MQTISTINDLRKTIKTEKQAGRRIAFVPTMGNLHSGHLSLIKRARELGDCIVASIFVNPLQFGANEDLDNYPRTLQEDMDKLLSEGTDYLFTPTAKEIYPQGMALQTQVSVPDITDTLCGASRPGHFIGVATVVSKLFNIVQPDIALFGEKDFQQLAVIRKMAKDLCFAIEIIGVPTGRAEDGLALSSRNGYLSKEQRATAPQLHTALQGCRQDILKGCKDHNHLSKQYCVNLQEQGFTIDYFSICDSSTLRKVSPQSRKIVILVAASLGNTRLIDNVTLMLNPAGD